MRGWLGIAGLVAALGLSACAAPLQQSYGPVAAPLPSRSTPLDAYAWLDRADTLLDAIADAPPDYSFDHQGQRLFAWDVNGVLIVEEPGPEGYVLYLFERGASEPFFIRTPDFAAGFDRRRLAVIYTREGDVLAGADAWRRDYGAQPLQQRGFDVRRAAQRSRWDAQAARDWAGVQIFVSEARDAWDDNWRADRDYADYRRRSEAEAARAALADERRRRREAREDFRRWRDAGFAGAPPRGARPDRGDRPDRPRDRADRGDRPDRTDRPQDREERPVRPGTPPERPVGRPPSLPVVERPGEVVEPTLPAETEPDYSRAAPNGPTRPRLPRVGESSSGAGPAIIPVGDLLRDEEERRRTDAVELERVTRENEAAAQARREALAEEARQNEARRAAEETARQAQAAEAAEQAQRQVAAEEAQRRASEQANAADAERRAAEQAAAADAGRQEREAQAEARARAEAEARRREAERAEAEEARRRTEQEEVEARARAERRSREMAPVLEPQ